MTDMPEPSPDMRLTLINLWTFVQRLAERVQAMELAAARAAENQAAENLPVDTGPAVDKKPRKKA